MDSMGVFTQKEMDIKRLSCFPGEDEMYTFVRHGGVFEV